MEYEKPEPRGVRVWNWEGETIRVTMDFPKNISDDEIEQECLMLKRRLLDIRERCRTAPFGE